MHWPVGLGHQPGHNYTHNDDKKKKQDRSSTHSNKHRKTTEVKTAADREWRDMHHNTERAADVQDPMS
jgi:hypothetical protein